MSCCEKCWADAYMRTLSDPNKSRAEHYGDLLIERDHIPCSEKEKAGIYWDEERQCDSRNS
jgi:hypothetical protein